jgi:hypothetical protein
VTGEITQITEFAVRRLLQQVAFISDSIPGQQGAVIRRGSNGL